MQNEKQPQRVAIPKSSFHAAWPDPSCLGHQTRNALASQPK
jgi:hypothetical protein